MTLKALEGLNKTPRINFFCFTAFTIFEINNFLLWCKKRKVWNYKTQLHIKSQNTTSHEIAKRNITGNHKTQHHMKSQNTTLQEITKRNFAWLNIYKKSNIFIPNIDKTQRRICTSFNDAKTMSKAVAVEIEFTSTSKRCEWFRVSEKIFMCECFCVKNMRTQFTDAAYFFWLVTRCSNIISSQSNTPRLLNLFFKFSPNQPIEYESYFKFIYNVC